MLVLASDSVEGSIPVLIFVLHCKVHTLSQTEDALPGGEAVYSPIATHIRLAKQYVQYPLVRWVRKGTWRKILSDTLRRLSLHLLPMIFEMRNSKDSIEERFDLALQHSVKLPAAPHPHEHIRQGHECRQSPQDIIGEAGQPGRDCDRHGHLKCAFVCA
jgi:hypothetical protein